MRDDLMNIEDLYDKYDEYLNKSEEAHMSWNRNEFTEYVSGASDAAVAVLAFSLEIEVDRLIGLETKEYTVVCLGMDAIAQKEFHARELNWDMYKGE
jgi:hypothetical protein